MDITLVKFIVALKRLNLTNEQIKKYFEHTQYADINIDKTIKEMDLLLMHDGLEKLFDLYLGDSVKVWDN